MVNFQNFILFVCVVALPFMLKHLLETKGLAVTLQVESGLLATTILCALVFKPKAKETEIASRRFENILVTFVFLMTNGLTVTVVCTKFYRKKM